MLVGEKVVLRPVKRSDIEYFLKWFNDPEVTQYLGMYLPMTEMAEEKFIEDLGSATAGKRVMFVIEAVEDTDKKPIGSIGLSNIHPKDHHAVFGIAIGEKDYWSKGYGTEAARLIIRYGFEQLNLHRINSFAIAFNERSLRLHLRVGFKEEGREREAIFRNGAYHDHVVFGLLRTEWLAMHTTKEK
ncbi:MAG: GNAT family N-acetyltransferase [Dehalococcoidales bacterium]|nr:MAG: GNAT family N-acetyltransferase [Dehalococcoidales bacterium]